MPTDEYLNREPAAAASKQKQVGKGTQDCSAGSDVDRLSKCLSQKMGQFYNFPRTGATDLVKGLVPSLAGLAEDSFDYWAAGAALAGNWQAISNPEKASPEALQKAKQAGEQIAHFRGCMPTQAMVNKYLQQCLNENGLADKYDVKPVAINEGQNFPHPGAHYANALVPRGGDVMSGTIFDPWIKQSLDGMTYPPSAWSAMQGNGAIVVKPGVMEPAGNWTTQVGRDLPK